MVCYHRTKPRTKAHPAPEFTSGDNFEFTHTNIDIKLTPIR
jgi:hypothetical protein